MNKAERADIERRIAQCQAHIASLEAEMKRLKKRLSTRPSIKPARGRGFDMESIFHERDPGVGDKVEGLGKRSKITRAKDSKRNKGDD